MELVSILATALLVTIATVFLIFLIARFVEFTEKGIVIYRQKRARRKRYSDIHRKIDKSLREDEFTPPPSWLEVVELAEQALKFDIVHTKSDLPMTDEDREYFLKHDLLSNPRLFDEMTRAVSARQKQEQEERDRYDYYMKIGKLKAKGIEPRAVIKDWDGNVVREVY